MIYGLLIVFTFPHIGNSRIDHFMDLPHDFTMFTHIEKMYDYVGKKNVCAIRLDVKHRKGRSKL